MKITILGTGYVGLVTGACLAHSGHHVTCCDIDTAKIQRLNSGDIPFYEEGLGGLVSQGIDHGTLMFSATLEDAITDDTEAVFLAVSTPQASDGHADLRFVDTAVDQLIMYFRENPMARECVLVTKSTVSVGTTARLAARISEAGLRHVFVANNPEFLREGTAVSDFMSPDRIVVGCDSDLVRTKMKAIYRSFLESGVPFVSVGYADSELIKYASNTFLAAKVAFINELAVLAETVGANVYEVAHGMGLDPRIGASFLRPGPGYGGSCFPKDVSALAATARASAIPLGLVNAISESNDRHKVWVFEKITRVAETYLDPKGALMGRHITLLGVAFKANTDDIRDSVAIEMAYKLLAAGAVVTVCDPEAMPNARHILGDRVRYVADAEAALMNADMGVVLTEWPVFQRLDMARVGEAMKHPLIVDMRGLWSLAHMRELGFVYVPIGIAV